MEAFNIPALNKDRDWDRDNDVTQWQMGYSSRGLLKAFFLAVESQTDDLRGAWFEE